MKCKNCNKEIEKESKFRKYCNNKCKWSYEHKKYYPKMRDKKIKNANERYYNNKELILKQQIERKNKRYKEDKEFRDKDNFRKRTSHKFSLNGKECIKCGTSFDLQRHHLNYENHKEFEILCRKCHNLIHKS